jgi:hypothetical protein
VCSIASRFLGGDFSPRSGHGKNNRIDESPKISTIAFSTPKRIAIMVSTLTISGKVLGRSKPLFTDWSLSLPGEPLTLEDLLTHIVHAEIDAFRTRQEQRRLVKVLSPVEIDRGIASGKIDSGGRDILQKIDEEEALKNALQSFQDGFYFVFIDDQQIENLDSLVALSDSSEILFLRLIPLVGG